MSALAALEEDAEASIRVVPPSFRSLTGAGNSAFSYVHTGHQIICIDYRR